MIGVSFGFHDAAVSEVYGDHIAFAAHSERYSRVKNDKWLNPQLIDDLRANMKSDDIVYYEKPWLKAIRQYMTGQSRPAIGVRDHIRHMFGSKGDIHTVGHHESHAAAGFYTSRFTEAAIVVVDAIGEFDTVSIWEGRGAALRKVWSQRYPHSLGLLYSAFTQRVGLTPNEHEYILMGMAAFGDPAHIKSIDARLIDRHSNHFKLLRNVHKGIGDFMPEASDVDLAASIQWITEKVLIDIFRYAAKITGMKNVCYQGGVALNCKANTEIIKDGAFDDYWIMPNAGDAGASLGAVLAKTRRFVEWRSPALGKYLMPYDSPSAVADKIVRDGVIGLAQGRAEFGPRALGNRSILADPRTQIMKNRVNDIKKREQFRPFAPMILSEHVDDYFTSHGADLRYMQYAVPCKRPLEIPAVVHVDGTSRVQSVGKDDGYIRSVLEHWYDTTGCPVLLNTSLNIKGSPLVNDESDARSFAEHYGIGVM